MNWIFIEYRTKTKSCIHFVLTMRELVLFTAHILLIWVAKARIFVSLKHFYFLFLIWFASLVLERSKHLRFRAPYTLYGWGVDQMYNMEKQTEKFNERFGKDKKITESNIKKCNYFSRNHLTPHADFAKVSEQELTYYFQNCVPGEYSVEIFIII